MLKADEGKVIIHKDELKNQEENTVLTGSKEVYLSDTDSADNYVEIEEIIEEEVENNEEHKENI